MQVSRVYTREMSPTVQPAGTINSCYHSKYAANWTILLNEEIRNELNIWLIIDRAQEPKSE